MKQPSNSALNLGLVAMVLVLLASSMLTYRNAERLRDSSRWLAHTLQILDAISDTLSLVKDGETAARGYIITGDESFLPPYKTAAALVDSRIQLISQLTSDNPAQQARMPALKQMIDEKFSRYVETIALRRDKGFDAARAHVADGTGYALMSSLRTLAAQMQADERALLIQRSADVDRSYHIAVLSGAVSGLIGLLLLAVAVYLLRRNLSARARAAAEIETQRELLRVTLASIGDAVIATDTEGRITFMNTVAVALTEWSEHDALRLKMDSVFRIVNETTRLPVDNPAIRAMNEGAIIGLANHTILIGRGGAEHAIEDSAAPIRDAENRVLGSVLVFRDVTSARATEIALRNSEERYRALVEQARDFAIFMIDPSGTVLTWNEGVHQLTGYEEDEFVGQSFASLLFAQSSETADIHKDLDVAASQGSVSYNCWMQRKDGSQFWTSGVAATLHDKNGALSGFTCVVRDLTENKIAADNVALLLQQAEQRTVRLWQVSAAAVSLNASLTQESALGVLQQEARKIIGAEAAEIEIGESASPVDGKLSAPLVGHGGRKLGYLHLSRKTEGEFLSDDEAILMQLAQQAAVAFENARLYQELRVAEQRKDEFIATLSHELRNPLAPIRYALDIIQLSDGNAKTIKRSVAAIERQHLQLVRLVDELLDLSRITRGTMNLLKRPEPLAAIIDQALETAMPIIKAAGHEAFVNLPDLDIVIDADATRLAQVFSNLLINAAKYTPSGGTIRVIAVRDADSVAVSVEDNGVGISAEMLPRVFDIFSQESRLQDQAQGGLGIGLTLVRKLVSLHDGTIEAFSNGPNCGSRFVVRLPVMDAEIPPAPTALPIENTAGTDAVRPRILVVDDNRESTEGLSILLDIMGYEARVAHDGIEAIEIASTYAPAVILLDIGLPRLNGYETCRRIRLLLDHVQIVAMTGWGQEEDRRRSREAGFDHHLVKPVSYENLQSLLTSLTD